MRSTRKKAPKLIGFNEDPVDTRNLDGYTIPVEKLVVQDTNKASFSLDHQNAAASLQYNKSALEEQTSLSVTRPLAKICETPGQKISQHENDFRQNLGNKKVTESDDQKNRDGMQL